MEYQVFRATALRMDVEGAELMVLEGAREVLRNYKPCLFIEFHNFAEYGTAFARLSKNCAMSGTPRPQSSSAPGINLG